MDIHLIRCISSYYWGRICGSRKHCNMRNLCSTVCSSQTAQHMRNRSEWCVIARLKKTSWVTVTVTQGEWFIWSNAPGPSPDSGSQPFVAHDNEAVMMLVMLQTEPSQSGRSTDPNLKPGSVTRFILYSHGKPNRAAHFGRSAHWHFGQSTEPKPQPAVRSVQWPRTSELT